jgi:cytoskeletal protein CcmA (bactofilin family)
MFRKTTEKTPRKTSRQEISTLLGKETRITGDVEFTGGLHVDGTVVGNVFAAAGAGDDASLSVSEGGVVEGSVKAPEVVLNGTVKGDVTATRRVELGPTAKVIGNVVYQLIEMAIGAEVNGKLVHADSAGASGAPADPSDGAPAPELAAAEEVEEEEGETAPARELTS